MNSNEIESGIEKSLREAIKQYLITMGQVSVKGRHMVIDKVTRVFPKFDKNKIDLTVLLNLKVIELNITGVVSLVEKIDDSGVEREIEFEVFPAKINFEELAFLSDVSRFKALKNRIG